MRFLKRHDTVASLLIKITCNFIRPKDIQPDRANAMVCHLFLGSVQQITAKSLAAMFWLNLDAEDPSTHAKIMRGLQRDPKLTCSAAYPRIPADRNTSNSSTVIDRKLNLCMATLSMKMLMHSPLSLLRVTGIYAILLPTSDWRENDPKYFGSFFFIFAQVRKVHTYKIQQIVKPPLPSKFTCVVEVV